MANTTKNNVIKSAIVTTLLATSKTLAHTELNKTNNVTDNIQWYNGTSVNYTTPNRWINHNFTGHYDPTKHTHEQNIQRAIQAKLIRAHKKLENVQNGSVHIHKNQMYSMSLTKKNGEYQLLIEINEDAPTNIHGLKDIWHWTCYHTFHFAIVRLGFDKIDWLSAKSIALIITKKILKKVFTGGIPGLIVTFLWVEVAHKHVGSFAQHGSNRICGTDYSNIDNKFSKALKFGETSRNRSRNKPSPQGVKLIRG